KSKIVQLFAEAIGANFKMVPVKPEWSDSTDLLGYRNIEGKFIPGIITSIAYDAIKNPKFPYFICLDEMNLARVEYYFSDILSLMETRKMKENSNIVTEKLLNKEQFGTDRESFEKYKDVYIPENLYIIGTVNMDETTFPFSKKVLDRANVIEFNKVNLFYDFENTSSKKEEYWIYDNEFLKSEFLKLADCKEYKDIAIKVIDELVKINSILERYNKQFGLRIRDEIVFYMIYALKDNVMDFNKALDYCILQKILPKISGSDIEVFDILIKLFNLFNNTKYDINLEKEQLKEMNKEVNSSKYKLTSEKLINMIRRFIENGFTTFWN
ncbi:MAG: AAA family ATPase, partial [Clostridium sp.]|nr:AAA family ATPase [Clostridium sp.]